jgi:hypothetical protein
VLGAPSEVEAGFELRPARWRWRLGAQGEVETDDSRRYGGRARALGSGERRGRSHRWMDGHGSRVNKQSVLAIRPEILGIRHR